MIIRAAQKRVMGLPRALPVLLHGHPGLHPLSFRFFSKKETKKWLLDHKKDPYVIKSVAMDYRSRAAFKLTEIDDKYHILRKPTRILELGCAPGGWTQVVLRRGNPKARFMALDREKMKPFDNPLDKRNPNFSFVQADITDVKTQGLIKQFFGNELAELVLSDMAPNIVGEAFQDAQEIGELNAKCIEACQLILQRGGTLVMKTFFGLHEPRVYRAVSLYFQKVVRIKPASSRSKSPEIYYLCLGHQQSPFFDLVAKKGYDISLEEFSTFFPDIKDMTEREMRRMLQSVRERAEKEGLKESDIKFKFEKELYARPVEPEEKKKVTYEEFKNDVIRIYEVAKRDKLIDEIPTMSPAADFEAMEKKARKWDKEIRGLMETQDTKFELLDLDEEREAVEERKMLEDDELPTDFRFHWQKDYDEYLWQQFKEDVVARLKTDKNLEGKEEEEYQRKVDKLATERGISREKVEEVIKERERELSRETEPWLGDANKLRGALDDLERKSRKAKEWDEEEAESFVGARLKQARARAQDAEKGKEGKTEKNEAVDVEEIDPKEQMAMRKDMERMMNEIREATHNMDSEAMMPLEQNARVVEERRDRQMSVKEAGQDRETQEKVRSVKERREKQKANPKKSK